MVGLNLYNGYMNINFKGDNGTIKFIQWIYEY